LYPAFGPSSGKKGQIVKEDKYKETKIFEILGEDGMTLFKRCITLNNNERLRDEFFCHNLIRKIWPCVRVFMTEEACFGKKGPNKDLKKTYKLMTNIVEKTYGLKMPEFWRDTFSF